jgi:hypothetical protein
MTWSWYQSIAARWSFSNRSSVCWPGSVRVRIVVAGVGFPDVVIREGTYPGGPKPPFTPGYDFIGTVDKLGAGVTGVDLDQTVGAITVVRQLRGLPLRPRQLAGPRPGRARSRGGGEPRVQLRHRLPDAAPCCPGEERRQAPRSRRRRWRGDGGPAARPAGRAGAVRYGFRNPDRGRFGSGGDADRLHEGELPDPHPRAHR